MGSNVAPTRFELIIVLMVVVCCLGCLGYCRIRHHPPPPDCFIPQFLDRIARLLGIINYKELTLRQTYHIALLLLFSLL